MNERTAQMAIQLKQRSILDALLYGRDARFHRLRVNDANRSAWFYLVQTDAEDRTND